MRADLPTPPPLNTLTRKPTWVNNHGRIDRSACIELRAGDIWRLAELRPARTLRAPGSRRPSVRVWREAAGEFTLTADRLAFLHSQRKPQSLHGDFRTSKSNAMKNPRDGDRTPSQVARWNPWPDNFQRTPELRHPPAMNPNKGATRTKMLGIYGPSDLPGLERGWEQTVRIERWRLHSNLAQHFLICPACHEKFRKLFTVLCSQDEMHDALLAEGWIDLLDARARAGRIPVPLELRRERQRIVDRYAPIFRNRKLVCRKCLKIRYGASGALRAHTTTRVTPRA